MNKLNTEYFETREEHKKKVSSKSWLYVIPILLILLGLIAITTNQTKKIDQSMHAETMGAIDLGIQNSDRTSNETWVNLENLGLTVQLHSGLKYNYSEAIKTLTATSQDSSEIAYLIGEVPKNMNKPNMKELWLNSTKEKDPNLSFRDSLNYIIVETVKNQKQYKGILMFKNVNGNELVLNSVTLKRKFNEIAPKMHKLFESIKAN